MVLQELLQLDDREMLFVAVKMVSIIGTIPLTVLLAEPSLTLSSLSPKGLSTSHCGN